MATIYNFVFDQLRIPDRAHLLSKKLENIMNEYFDLKRPFKEYAHKCSFCGNSQYLPTITIYSFENEIYIERIIYDVIVETRITVKYGTNDGSVDFCYRIYDNYSLLIMHKSYCNVKMYLFVDDTTIESLPEYSDYNVHYFCHSNQDYNINVKYNCIINNIESIDTFQL
jgi:hypothetical protein